MNVQRALKVRLYSTFKQASFLNLMLGWCRFLYNQILAKRIQADKALKDDKEALRAHHYKREKEYKMAFEFLKKADTFALPQAQRNLESAYTDFFNSLKGARKGKADFPQLIMIYKVGWASDEKR